MAARGGLRRLAQQLRSSAHIRTYPATPQRTAGLLGTCERQGLLGARGSQRSRYVCTAAAIKGLQALPLNMLSGRPQGASLRQLAFLLSCNSVLRAQCFAGSSG